MHPPTIASNDSPSFLIGTDESEARKRMIHRKVTEIVSFLECVCVCVCVCERDTLCVCGGWKK